MRERRRMVGPAWKTLYVALPGILTGCVTFEGNRGAVPFFEVFRDEPAGPPPSSVPPTGLPPTGAPSSAPLAPGPTPPPGEPPWPLEPPRGREVVVRPFLSHARHGPDRSRLRVLWPIGDFLRAPGESRDWIFPIWYRQVRPEPDGRPARRWMVFPFFFGGRIPSEGGYFAFFPVAGKIRGLLGQDEIDLYVLPIYWHSRYQEVHSLHLLFPFYNRMWGGGRSGARVWPFYGRYRARTPDGRERYDRSFALWPFVYWQRNELNTRYPSKLFFVFPFYGQSESGRTLTRTYLWPIFHTTLDKRTGKKTYFGFLIPYRFAEGQFDLWPIYGRLRVEEEDPVGLTGTRKRNRHFILWPIERYDRSEDDRRLSTRFWLLPFYWRFRDVRKEDGQEDLEWKVWPLIRYRRVGAEATLYFPSPLWFRQEKPFERLYARLWRLFLYRDDPRVKGWEALFATFSYRNLKGEGTRTFSVLGGLFERRSGPSGKTFRFFYLPWRRDR